ncbi:MAG: oxidoreductase [Actinotalea sp.]|nr:oxidoreductase [Actinotalea sp.]
MSAAQVDRVEVLRYAAFTDGGRGGNPAGVVLDATALDEGAMQRIAREVGFSETAFLRPTSAAGRYAVRYFSPRAEVAFCGHATVAAVVALADRSGAASLDGVADSTSDRVTGSTVVLETAVGDVAVTTATGDGSGAVRATLTSVPTRTRPATAAEVERVLRALRWAPADLDPRYPAHVAFAGNDHLVLAAGSRERLAALDYDLAALGALMAETGWTTVHLVAAETATLFHARDPFPPGGVVEDPATGAAAAAFGGYLRDLGLVPVPSTVTVLQGSDMGRPSRLVVDVDEGRRVRVSGTAHPMT